MKTVWKIMGESYDIRESKEVYATLQSAMEGAKEWEGFLGTSLEEALAYREIWVEEWELID